MRRHLCAVPSGPVIDTVEQWRRTWDPVMASVVPAHVTITYPEETVDEELLLRRAETALGRAQRFRLRLGEVFAEDAGHGGVFVMAYDVDGGWADLRQRLLAEPMTPVNFPAHLTIAHPRTASRGGECYAALASRCLDSDVWVREVRFTEATADTYAVLRRFPLPMPPAG